MPFKEICSGRSKATSRRSQLQSFKCVVVAAVLEFFLDPAADPHFSVWFDGEVTTVKEDVQIAAQQEAIANLMRTVKGIGLDVSGFKDGERALTGYSASSVIRISHNETERTLSQARSDRDGIAIPPRLLSDASKGRPRDLRLRTSHSVFYLLPECSARRGCGVVGPSLDNVLSPLRRSCDPIWFAEEERLNQDTTPDLMSVRIDTATAIASYSVDKFRQTRRTVLFLECFPRHPDRERAVVSEVRAADDSTAMRRMQFE